MTAIPFPAPATPGAGQSFRTGVAAMKLNQDTIIAMMEDLTGAGGAFDPAALWVGLFTAINDLGQATALSDLTQATGDMALRVDPVAWGNFVRRGDGQWYRQVTTPALFVPADATEGQTIIGWFFVTAAVAGTLLAWELFPEPIEVVDEHSQITVLPRILFNPNSGWSMTEVING